MENDLKQIVGGKSEPLSQTPVRSVFPFKNCACECSIVCNIQLGHKVYPLGSMKDTHGDLPSIWEGGEFILPLGGGGAEPPFETIL